MSAQAVEEVIHRAERDPAYADQLRHDPDAALHGLDISYPERQALISGDAAKLVELGVDRDVSLLADKYNPVRQEPTR